MSKISIKGADTGTGVFTLESPATNTDRTLVLPDEAGTIDTLQRAGNVLQVVQTYSTTRIATNTNDYSLISCAITPTYTTSKVLVLINICTGYTNNNGMRFYRNGVEQTAWEASATWASLGNVLWGADEPPVSNNYALAFIPVTILDSPASTSALTYEIRTRIPGTDYWYFNRDANSATDSFGASSITLMEIAA